MTSPASKILMVRPSGFGFNPETAESNSFQRDLELTREEIARRAVSEFDAVSAGISKLGIDVNIVNEPAMNDTPDAVFPNNWFSTHIDGTLCLYPMEAPARRFERRLLDQILEVIHPERVLDLTGFEKESAFLEGTGSLILDHEKKVAFACGSSRTHPAVLDKWSREMGFETVLFGAVDRNGEAIYHTNVMMCLGLGFGVVCLDAISDEKEKANFLEKFHQTNRELIEITFTQMESFAGNMIQLSADGRPILIMSETARKSLNAGQLSKLQSYSTIGSFDIETIEICGGGSVRCMIAELF